MGLEKASGAGEQLMNRLQDGLRIAFAAFVLSTTTLSGEAHAQEGLKGAAEKLLKELPKHQDAIKKSTDRLKELGVQIGGAESKVDVSKLSEAQIRNIAKEKLAAIDTLSKEIEAISGPAYEKLLAPKRNLRQQYAERGRRDEAAAIGVEMDNISSARTANLVEVDRAGTNAKSASRNIEYEIDKLSFSQDRAETLKKIESEIQTMEAIRQSLSKLRDSIRALGK
ncbi:hypothetical protein HY968_05155 [Candidatus Kaiserbacteria bacterium]|nr:hypothetical protein [Candidatus Kaiserbacteria bacterium]